MRDAHVVHASGHSWRVQIADSFLARARGLIGKSELLAEEGMLFPNASSLHMLFMRFAIDVVFVDRPDRENRCRIVALRAELAPWTGVVWGVRGVWGAIELASGSIALAGLDLGDELIISTRERLS